MPNPTDKSDLSDAILREWTWKTPAMKEMTLAICRLALARGSTQPFSANDLPEFAHGGPGICGSVFHRLQEDGVIARVGHFIEDKFCPLIVMNKGGNKLSVWRLASHARARTLLAVHGQPEPELRQQEIEI